MVRLLALLMGLFPLSPFSFLVLLSYFLLIVFQFMFDTLEVLWVFMELLTFILMGVIFTSTTSSTASFSVVSYFITQRMLSMLMLVTILILHFSGPFLMYYLLFFVVVFSKLGRFPFSNWYYSSVVLLPNFILLLVLTVHKFPLLYILCLVSSTFAELPSFWYALMLYLILNLFVSGARSINSREITSLVLNTSIANNSWLLISSMLGVWVMISFVSVYSFLLLLVFSNNSVVSTWSLIAVSGLPPFPMFFMKLLVITLLLLGTGEFLLACVFILASFVVSFSYLRFVFRQFTLRVHP